MWSLVVVSRHQQSDAVGAFVVSLDAELHLVPQVRHDVAHPQGGVVEVSGVEALCPDPSGQGLGVSCQPVRVDMNKNSISSKTLCKIVASTIYPKL